jgi:hypothetical protein
MNARLKIVFFIVFILHIVATIIHGNLWIDIPLALLFPHIFYVPKHVPKIFKDEDTYVWFILTLRMTLMLALLGYVFFRLLPDDNRFVITTALIAIPFYISAIEYLAEKLEKSNKASATKIKRIQIALKILWILGLTTLISFELIKNWNSHSYIIIVLASLFVVVKIREYVDIQWIRKFKDPEFEPAGWTTSKVVLITVLILIVLSGSEMKLETLSDITRDEASSLFVSIFIL